MTSLSVSSLLNHSKIKGCFTIPSLLSSSHPITKDVTQNQNDKIVDRIQHSRLVLLTDNSIHLYSIKWDNTHNRESTTTFEIIKEIWNFCLTNIICGDNNAKATSDLITNFILIDKQFLVIINSYNDLLIFDLLSPNSTIEPVIAPNQLEEHDYYYDLISITEISPYSVALVYGKSEKSVLYDISCSPNIFIQKIYKSDFKKIVLDVLQEAPKGNMKKKTPGIKLLNRFLMGKLPSKKSTNPIFKTIFVSNKYLDCKFIKLYKFPLQIYKGLVLITTSKFSGSYIKDQYHQSDSTARNNDSKDYSFHILSLDDTVPSDNYRIFCSNDDNITEKNFFSYNNDVIADQSVDKLGYCGLFTKETIFFFINYNPDSDISRPPLQFFYEVPLTATISDGVDNCIFAPTSKEVVFVKIITAELFENKHQRERGLGLNEEDESSNLSAADPEESLIRACEMLVLFNDGNVYKFKFKIGTSNTTRGNGNKVDLLSYAVFKRHEFDGVVDNWQLVTCFIEKCSYPSTNKLSFDIMGEYASLPSHTLLLNESKGLYFMDNSSLCICSKPLMKFNDYENCNVDFAATRFQNTMYLDALLDTQTVFSNLVTCGVISYNALENIKKGVIKSYSDVLPISSVNVMEKEGNRFTQSRINNSNINTVDDFWINEEGDICFYDRTNKKLFTNNLENFIRIPENALVTKFRFPPFIEIKDPSVDVLLCDSKKLCHSDAAFVVAYLTKNGELCQFFTTDFKDRNKGDFSRLKFCSKSELVSAKLIQNTMFMEILILNELVSTLRSIYIFVVFNKKVYVIKNMKELKTFSLPEHTESNVSAITVAAATGVSNHILLIGMTDGQMLKMDFCSGEIIDAESGKYYALNSPIRFSKRIVNNTQDNSDIIIISRNIVYHYKYKKVIPLPNLDFISIVKVTAGNDNRQDKWIGIYRDIIDKANSINIIEFELEQSLQDMKSNTWSRNYELNNIPIKMLKLNSISSRYVILITNSITSLNHSGRSDLRLFDIILNQVVFTFNDFPPGSIITGISEILVERESHTIKVTSINQVLRKCFIVSLNYESLEQQYQSQKRPDGLPNLWLFSLDEVTGTLHLQLKYNTGYNISNISCYFTNGITEVGMGSHNSTNRGNCLITIGDYLCIWKINYLASEHKFEIVKISKMLPLNITGTSYFKKIITDLPSSSLIPPKAIKGTKKGKKLRLDNIINFQYFGMIDPFKEHIQLLQINENVGNNTDQCLLDFTYCTSTEQEELFNKINPLINSVNTFSGVGNTIVLGDAWGMAIVKNRNELHVFKKIDERAERIYEEAHTVSEEQKVLSGMEHTKIEHFDNYVQLNFSSRIIAVTPAKVDILQHFLAYYDPGKLTSDDRDLLQGFFLVHTLNGNLYLIYQE
ncbi:Mlo127p SCDLUD_003498 [Saccharomycodes ludwigii]|uniref:Mlo127p n=1 Tax=Saccharomycodes ludwigii TaxID=36035 RepID=UPI001E89C271|nr:hypothetical protein SCDLUD_003498 [Saccharomycodes ludwigii]KAH3900512.1 hypothetical protein SCDLUD_003498 [Saccharomycodes ludwigii]